MATVNRVGNRVYVTAAGQVYATTSPIKIEGVLISPATAGSGNPTLTLVDQSPAPQTIGIFACPNNETIYLPFDSPIEAYGGFSVSSLSGAVATILVTGGP